MLFGFIFSYLESFFVVFFLSFYFILALRISVRDTSGSRHREQALGSKDATAAPHSEADHSATKLKPHQNTQRIQNCNCNNHTRIQC